MNSRYRIITANLKNKKHREAFASLIDEYRRGPSGDGVGVDRPGAARLIRGMQRHPGARVYFAVCGGSVAGCATCFTGFSTFAARKLMNIHDLVVTKKFRRTGAARAMLQHIEALAARGGFCKLTLEVRSDNDPALSLYARAGFGPGKHLMYFLTKSLP